MFAEDSIVYAAWSKDEEVRINSTSGGIFTELAKEVLSQGGYVAGAAYNDNFDIFHRLISKKEDLPLLRQSKYAQSKIGNVLSEIKVLLQSGNTVLFCGTPCQGVGLRLFLGKDYSNLIICDFICRGVNSPKVYKLYLKMLEKRNGSPIQKVQFKNKKYGWNWFHTKVEFANKKPYYGDRFNDPFMQGYLCHNLFIRPSCYECRFKEDKRYSDISLGDFWGIGAKYPHMDQDKGTSVVMANTPKGNDLVKKIKKRIVYEVCSFDDVKRGNPALTSSASLHSQERNKFFEDLEDNMPFNELVSKHCRVLPYERIKRWIRCKILLLKYYIKGILKG
jgi:coenzyme F420-reducing hydrogenase beta subunit